MRRRNFIAAAVGAGFAWPFAGRAPGKAVPMIGWLHFGSPGPFGYQVAAFRQALAKAGYVEGQDVAIEYRWAEGHNERLPGLAADLVANAVAVIAAEGPPAALAAKHATATIPIVFSVGIDPVEAGLVASIPRPGGNLTGISVLASELLPKHVDLLSQLVPHARVFGLLVNPDEAGPWIADVDEAVRAKGLPLAKVEARNKSEIAAAFATLADRHADALVIGDSVFFTFQRNQLVALTARYRLPAIERWREFAVAGGLISYGPSLVVVNQQLGEYVARILKGAKPADLPVQQPTKFDLVLNLQTAEALGLTVPETLLVEADEVIR
jgi:putative tryptophan/tyrosine transport system substrate-binding protein